MKSEIFHLEATFKGKVQGVGFRFQTLKIARGFEVAGTIKNLSSGDVLLCAEAVSERELEDFFAAVFHEMKFFIRDFEKRIFVAPASANDFRIVE